MVMRNSRLLSKLLLDLEPMKPCNHLFYGFRTLRSSIHFRGAIGSRSDDSLRRKVFTHTLNTQNGSMRCIANVSQSNMVEEEIGKRVSNTVRIVYSPVHTFDKGEIVVVKQSCGSVYGRIEDVDHSSSQKSTVKYLVCVDEMKSRFLKEPPEVLGKIVSLLSDTEENTKKDLMYAPSSRMKSARINNMHMYHRMYRDSIENPELFWRTIAEEFHWEQKWHTLNKVNFDVQNGPVSIEWFLGGKTNLCYNSVDRHVKAGKGDLVAFLWEGNDGETDKITYKELLEQVCKFANVLKSRGVKKGDIVSMYMPMILELPIAMLACARIGAVHSVVFGGFSAEALSNRLVDSKSKLLITADGVMRGSKLVQLKSIADLAVDHAMDHGHCVEHCIVAQRLGPHKVPLSKDREYELWHEVIAKASAECPVEWLDSEDRSFLLYTSGSTGKPKGIIHTTAGYMVWAASTFKYVLDYQPGDVYWCTADCGWITGHTYIAYGPTLNAATQVIFEGVPTHPTYSRCWEIIDRYKVSQFYTAPTAIRSLMGQGSGPLQGFSLESLRVLGTVGEPISPDAWKWFHEEVGRAERPIVDTWWQTETGGHMISPLPGATPLKPGSASLPFFGVEPVVLDQLGNELGGPCTGYLAIKQSWPGMLRGVLGDQSRFEETYFTLTNAQNAVISHNKYITGDACRRDADGYFWITGRIDDVINVSGHRVGTAEVESALSLHPLCIEAAVVGVPHHLKGEAIYAFVTLRDGGTMTPEIQKELKQTVRNEIGAFATPDVIHWAPGLPKTRSGKIMRRILRKLSMGVSEVSELGDLSTLADPAVVKALMETKNAAV